MHSDPAEYLNALPPLGPQLSLQRPVSASEYYHASVGTSSKSLELPRHVYFILRGQRLAELNVSDMQQAIAQVAEVNPGIRLRWQGCLGYSRWSSDGALPRLRIIEDSSWDGHSNQGAEFLDEQSLSLRDGPCAEFIWVRQANSRGLMVLRSLHAVMDGMGGMHILAELFRALRGETLLGSNAVYSDADLMRAMQIQPVKHQPYDTCALTGAAQGDSMGDDWWRLSLGPVQPRLLSQLALASTNFSNMLFVQLPKGALPSDFDAQLQSQIQSRQEAAYPTIYDWLRWIPLSWFDYLLGRRLSNFNTRKPIETVVISNIGKIDLMPFRSPQFAADDFIVPPMPGNAFVVLYSLNNHIELVLGLPRILSGQARLQALTDWLHSRFGSAKAAPI
ncbi:MAG: hypothetical protein NTX56_04740 [Proteobacteria bacterium]|nr:hypothetical protein [Pseudomonadota bacterium]